MHTDTNGVETYNASGYPLSVRDQANVGWTYNYAGFSLTGVSHSSGRSISLAYQNGRVSSATDPAGNVYTYSYNANGYLSGVSYPGGTGTRTYFYENSSVLGGLTGIANGGLRYSTYTYDASGHVTSSALAGGLEKLSFIYTANSTQVTNAAGAITLYSYAQVHGATKLVSLNRSGVTGCPNAAQNVTYDVNGNLATQTDWNGNITRYSYEGGGRLLQISTGENAAFPGQKQIAVYNWDLTNNRINSISTYGDSLSSPVSQTAYAYYPAGNAAVNRLSSVSVYNKTAQGVANQAQVTSYSYTIQTNGLPSQMVVDGPVPGNSDALTYNYNSAGDPTSVVNALGQSTTYASYNGLGLGLPGTATDANGLSTSIVYDGRGRVKSTSQVVSGVTRTTQYFYDVTGGVSQITYPDGNAAVLVYDATGRLTSRNWYLSTDQREQDYTYNTLGLLTSYTALHKVTTCVSSPSNNTASPTNAPDASLSAPDDTPTSAPAPVAPVDGSPTGTTTANTTTTCTPVTRNFPDYTQTTTYDEIGRAKTVTTGNSGTVTSYTYDSNGNVATVSDALNHTTTLSYDSHDRLIRSVDALGKTTSYGYDPGGNAASVTDPDGHITTYASDGFGHRVRIASPDTGTTSFTFDAGGRLTSMTRNDGSLTNYGYDGLSRLSSITAPSLTQTFGFDACTNGKGRLCSANEGSTTIGYAYTPTGQLASQTSNIAGTAYALSYTYDVLDHVTAVTYPGGNQATYHYNAMREVDTVSAVIGGVTTTVASSVTHKPYGPLASLTYGNGLNRTLAYDHNYRPTSIATGTLQSLALSYDTGSRVTQIANGINSTLSQSFGYDAVSRLTGVTAGIGNQTLAFDANGNPTSHLWNGSTDTFNLDAASNRINSLTGSRARTYGYNSLGNLKTSSGSVSYSYAYDGANRMSGITSGSSTTTYTYNALNQRSRKSGPLGSYNYLYDASGALMGETASGGTALTTQYLWLDGQPLAMIRSNALYYLHADQLGRPEAVTNASKAIVWQASNTAFDRSVATNTFGGLNLGFPGQYFDAESGLYYNLHRYYDPATGRYIESDPIGIIGGLNTYLYVGGNPISYVDRLGWIPNFMVPNSVINNTQNIVNSLTNNTFSQNQLNQLTSMFISQLSFSQAATLNGIIAQVPVVLTPSQVTVLQNVLAALVAQNPNNPDLLKAQQLFNQAIQNPDMCRVK